jgi:PKD domain
MLKLLTRSISVVLLLAAFAAPSAVAAKSSHSAGSRATHNRVGRRAAHSKRRHSHKGTAATALSRVAATISTTTLLGDTAVETHGDYLRAGHAKAFSFQASISSSGELAHVYLAGRNSARTVNIGLYSNVAGSPGSLLGSGTITNAQSGAWNTVSLTPTALVGGATYWLAVLGENGTLRFNDRSNGPCVSQADAQTGLQALASSWSAGGTSSTCPISAYVTGTSLVADPPPPIEPVEEKTPPVQKTPPVETLPAAPTATFLYTPTSPTVGQSVDFNAAGSVCADGPCTYGWSDDGSSARPSTVLWPLGSGQALSFTFKEVGTKYVRLVVTDAAGRTATVEHNVMVVAESSSPPPPPPPVAPSDTTSPSVSGTAQVKQTLTANKGTWSGSAPMTYTYQWQREGTTNITGATGSTYVPAAADVGHKLDVVVRAGNSVGAASASSAETTAVIKEAVKEEPKEVAKEEPKEVVKEEPKEVSGTQTNCIKVPSACGYPDATNTGVPVGTTLTSRSEEISVHTAGTTIKDVALDGTISVEANNTTIEDSEITVDGTETCGGSCGGRGIWIKPGVTGTVIKNVSCHGGALSGSNVTQYCVMSNDSATTIERLHAYNCTECLTGPMNLSNSFINESDAEIPSEHYEDIYYGGGAGPLIINHNTMLNQQGQTAVVFASVDFGDQTTLTITNNLMAGGGYMIYGGGSGSGGKVVGPVTISGNRFSREFYPDGGYYGVDAYMNESVTTWSGNVWDETLKPVEG